MGDRLNLPRILAEILKGCHLPLDGYHGVAHWARVLENGVRLAEATGADVRVVQLFAIFHDARRMSEGTDPDHGRRGAELAAALRGSHFRLPDTEFDLLAEACRRHTDGLLAGDVTLQVCWDADRLDLGRVGITPDPERLCTDAARRLLSWADDRAVRRMVPGFVRTSWGVSRPPPA